MKKINIVFFVVFAALLFIIMQNGHTVKKYSLNTEINKYKVIEKCDTIIIQRLNSKNKLLFTIKMVRQNGEYYWLLNGKVKILAMSNRYPFKNSIYKDKNNCLYYIEIRKFYSLYYTRFREPHNIVVAYDSLYHIKEISENPMAVYKEDGKEFILLPKLNTKSINVY